MALLNTMKVAIATAGMLGGLVLTTLPPAFAQTNIPTIPADHGGSMMQQGMPSDQRGSRRGHLPSQPYFLCSRTSCSACKDLIRPRINRVCVFIDVMADSLARR